MHTYPVSGSSSHAAHSVSVRTPPPSTGKTATAAFFQKICNAFQTCLPCFTISQAAPETSGAEKLLSLISRVLAPCRALVQPVRTLPLDANLYKKTLDNGLTFYVRKNAYPFPKKAYLRLVVRVGMLNETPAERGIAHLIEHIAQIETAHFPKDEIMNYLNLKGVHWARDNNAHTAAEETVYKLDIPLDDPETLEKALFILSEVASKATLSKAVIDNEREIVIDELSQNRHAWARYANEKRRLKCAGSPYATLVDRDKEIASVRECPTEVVQAFYKRWYQPNNMAVVAVGDFDQKKTGDLIEKYFGKIPPSSEPPSEHNYSLERNPETRFLCFAEPEITHSIVELHHQLPSLAQIHPCDTLDEKDLQHSLATSIFEILLTQRLKDISERDDSPFVSAAFVKDETIPGWPCTRLFAIAKEGHIPAAFNQLLLETKRIKAHGFLPSEFDRAKEVLLADYDHLVAEKGKTKSATFVKLYQDHFTKNSAAPDFEKYIALKRDVLRKLSVKKVNALTPYLLPESPPFISTAQPEKPDLPPVTAEILKQTIEQASLATVAPPEEEVYDRPLLKHLPKPGKIESTRHHKRANVTEYILKNGLRVFFKPTAFENDSVSIHAFSRTGQRDADMSKLASAKFSQDFFNACGIGDHDLKALRKILAGKKVGIASQINSYTTTFDATCVPKDLETALQYFHLMCTHPGYDRAAFDRAIKEAAEDLRNELNDPMVVFANTCNAINTQNHPHYTPLTYGDLDAIDYEACRDFHRQLHANPADFTLAIVGNVGQWKVKQLVERYLSSIPQTGTKRTAFDYSPVAFAAGITRQEVAGAKDSTCLSVLTFPAPISDAFDERCLSEWCCDLLESRLNKVLRFDMGKTYSQSCAFINTAVPGLNPHAPSKAIIILSCNPANRELLEQELFAQIRDLQVNGPTELEIADYKTNAAKQYANGLKTNAGWMQTIAYNALWERAQDDFDAEEKELKKLTAATAKEQFNKIFPLGNYALVTLLPKT